MAGRDTAALIVPRPTAVRLLHVSTRTFDRLEAAGVVGPAVPRKGTRGATYDAVSLVGAYLKHREEQLTGSVDSPRDRRDKALADWTQLRIDRERQLLLPRDEVVSEGQRYVAAVQARLRAVAPRLRQEAGAGEAITAKVEALIEEAIGEMAAWRDALALLESEDAA